MKHSLLTQFYRAIAVMSLLISTSVFADSLMGVETTNTPEKKPQRFSSKFNNQPLMESALQDLLRAEHTLKKAARNKGGHRVKALRHVKKAIEEVKRGMAHAEKR